MKKILILIVMVLSVLTVRADDEPLKKGDVNKDGSVTIADVTLLVDIILGKQTTYDVIMADVNGDSTISIADVTLLVDIILGKGGHDIAATGI